MFVLRVHVRNTSLRNELYFFSYPIKKSHERKDWHIARKGEKDSSQNHHFLLPKSNFGLEVLRQAQYAIV